MTVLSSVMTMINSSGPPSRSVAVFSCWPWVRALITEGNALSSLKLELYMTLNSLFLWFLFLIYIRRFCPILYLEYQMATLYLISSPESLASLSLTLTSTPHTSFVHACMEYVSGGSVPKVMLNKSLIGELFSYQHPFIG